MIDATGSTLIPCLRYRQAWAAIDWLCTTFGFERQLVVPDGEGTIAHAQLTLGRGMVMIGSLPASAGVLGGDDGGQTIHVVVADPDVIHDRARAAGATIVEAITAKDFGGRGFSCRDLEGYVWSFGSYDPWHSP